MCHSRLQVALLCISMCVCTSALANTANGGFYDEDTPQLFAYLLSYGLPFLAYYIGIFVRYYAKFLHDSPPPPLDQQLVAGIVFSFVAVVPLLPSIRLAVSETGVDEIAYSLILVVIMQEGLVLHERAVTAVKKLIRDDKGTQE